jgi:hypothetical protein
MLIVELCPFCYCSRVFHGIVTVQEHRGLAVQQGGAKVFNI